MYKSLYSGSKAVYIFKIINLALFACLISVAAFAWNFTIPAQEVNPDNNIFKFAEKDFADGKAKYFVYKDDSEQKIRFFIVKSDDEIIRAAFDACDVCFRGKKGYKQNGSDMVCVKCGLKFRTDKINQVKGGCNPGPLKRIIKDGYVIISKQDLLTGTGYFK
ncbi:DUF2318 domain-containing protein [Desulfobacterales bacterium HSG17]|nr:DUF2318 domain-containing protein [Desulfobacterales bacterium HSG17]